MGSQTSNRQSQTNRPSCSVAQLRRIPAGRRSTNSTQRSSGARVLNCNTKYPILPTLQGRTCTTPVSRFARGPGEKPLQWMQCTRRGQTPPAPQEGLEFSSNQSGAKKLLLELMVKAGL